MPAMRGTIEDWKRVSVDRALLERAAGLGAGDIAGLARLRDVFGETDSAIALELAQARRKAAAKFGGLPGALIADTAGVEQASGLAVARHKAGRIHEELGSGAAVADLCCGIGGDTLALCDAGLTVTAVDRDPVRAWMARHNSGGRTQGVCMDVADWRPEAGSSEYAIHLDPARRHEGTGRRMWKLDDLQPPPAVIARLIASVGDTGAAVKLSPGVDLDALDALVPQGEHEVEFIAEDNRLVQAVLWTGKLRRAERSATLIADDRTHTLDGEPGQASLGTIARYLYAVHPAAERAGLIHLLAEEHNAPLIHRKLGLMSRDTPIDSPWLTGFELLAELPWRAKKVKRWLSEHDAGIVEVKTRGKACEPDAVAKQLRGKGGTPYTVFVLRFDVRVVALVCRRVSHVG